MTRLVPVLAMLWLAAGCVSSPRGAGEQCFGTTECDEGLTCDFGQSPPVCAEGQGGDGVSDAAVHDAGAEPDAVAAADAAPGAPDAAPEPDATPTPDATPEPDATPAPDATPEPDAMPTDDAGGP